MGMPLKAGSRVFCKYLVQYSIRMFNNCDPKTNGEEKFFIKMKDKIQVIFDVGCRSDSEFINFSGDVHYFDPVDKFIENLKKQPNVNKASYFNAFGLGDENKELYYYPKYQSFYDRIHSCRVSDDSNKIVLSIQKGYDYLIKNNIQTIDFLKIDTEGYELNVLKGFEGFLKNIKVIQFEYGGTFLDNNTKLIDVKEYLEQQGFHKFSYLTNSGPKLITDFKDHYQYCNIVCIHTSCEFASTLLD
jgi:FkbM family methyltransferase